MRSSSTKRTLSHRTSRRVLLLAWVASIALSGLAPALAQLDEAPVVRETVDVRLIELDAVVTDRFDQPVLDLEPSDFELRVDGKKVAVTSVARGQELRDTVAGRLTVVVLLDDRHLQPVHRNRALGEIAEALDTEMSSSPTWVAVAALTDTGVAPLLAPSRDSVAMRQALEAAGSRPVSSNELRDQQRAVSNSVRDMLRNLTKIGSAYHIGKVSKSGVTAEVRAYGDALYRDTRATVDHVASLVEALSFVPGRKAVLFLSEGLPRNPLDRLAKTMYDRLAGGSRHYDGDDLTSQGANLFNDPSRRPTGSDRTDNSPSVRPIAQTDDGGAYAFQQAVAEFSCGDAIDRLAALANTHGVAFYPLKPPVVDPRLSGLEGRSEQYDSITVLTDMRSGLVSLATATGGLSFSAESGVADFLRQTRSDLSAYYSLSFTPPESMRASGIREMVLKVRRRKTQLRYQASYLPLLLTERLASRAWGTLVFGWQENELDLEVETRAGELGAEPQLDEVLDPSRAGWRRVEVQLSLPIGKLELATAKEAGDRSRRRSGRADRVASGAFRAVLQFRHHDGSRLTPEHLAFVVAVPEPDLEAARDQYFAVRTAIRLPEGRYDLAVGLWEENSGSTSYVLRSLQVGEAGLEVAAGQGVRHRESSVEFPRAVLE